MIKLQWGRCDGNDKGIVELGKRSNVIEYKLGSVGSGAAVPILSLIHLILTSPPLPKLTKKINNVSIENSLSLKSDIII